jgi:hypothetical protein
MFLLQGSSVGRVNTMQLACRELKMSCHEKTEDGLLLLYILYFRSNDVFILFASNICFL